MKFASKLCTVAAAVLALAASAHAATVTVNGNADLYNATAPGTYEGTDPVAIDVTGLSSITFSVSAGQTVTVNNANYNDADGIGSVSTEFNVGTSTLSGITAPTAGFIAGAFVGATTAGSAPAALNFITSGTSFASLAPTLQQAFFIGDGLTGDATGATQTFYVPTGATTLYLGLTDACGYNGGPSCYDDNFGSFTVTTQGTSATAAVPEPANITLLLAGIGGLGVVARRRRAVAAAAQA